MVAYENTITTQIVLLYIPSILVILYRFSSTTQYVLLNSSKASSFYEIPITIQTVILYFTRTSKSHLHSTTKSVLLNTNKTSSFI